MQPLGYRQFRWELLFAATVLVTLPMIVIFFLAQRSFIQGIATTGLKGCLPRSSLLVTEPLQCPDSGSNMP